MTEHRDVASEQRFGLGYELVILHGDGMRTVTQGIGVTYFPVAALSRKESEIMLNGAAAKLLAADAAFVTLHSAIYTTKYLSLAQRLIREEFAQ